MNNLNLQEFWFQCFQTQLIKLCIKTPRIRWELPKIFVGLPTTAKFFLARNKCPIWVNIRLARTDCDRGGSMALGRGDGKYLADTR